MGTPVPSNLLPDDVQTSGTPVPDNMLPDELRTQKGPGPIPSWFPSHGNPVSRQRAWEDLNNPGPMDIFADRVLGGTVRGIVGGWRGLVDLARGKGVQAATADINASPVMAPNSLTGRAMESGYNPLNWPDMAGQKAGDFAADQGAPPWLSTGVRIAPDVGMSLLGLRHGNIERGGSAAEPAALEHVPNIYDSAVQRVAGKQADFRARGAQAGLDLPESGTQARFDAASATNTDVADGLIRNHFGLPEDAPLHPDMMEEVRKQVGGANSSYAAIRRIPSIDLASDAQAALKDIPENSLGKTFSVPRGAAITGPEAVELSQRLRFRAKAYDKAASAGNPDADLMAESFRDAAEKVENSVKDHLRANDQEALALRWDKDRTTIAQTYDVEAALDRGHINVAKLAKRPYLSGDLEMLADLGQSNPDAFKVTRTNKPQPGFMRKAAGKALPMATTAGGAFVGSSLGFPTSGAIAGKAIGENLVERMLPEP